MSESYANPHAPDYSEIARSIENGWQMPARVYADPRLYEIEQEMIFKKSWQYVGRESSLTKPGDFITSQLGEVPILVVRDDEGRLHGHVNACRHRLHPVALEESGCKRLFQCRYHGWTFGHDGHLRAAPGMDQCDGFEKDKLGLIPIRVDAFRGCIFANADLEAEDLATFLGNATELVEAMDLNFLHWDHAGTFTYDVDADWKLFSENALECYHCPLVHQDTFSAHIGTQPEDYITQEFKNVLTHCAPITHAPGNVDVSEMLGFRFLFVWPSTALSKDDYVATISRIVPLGPQKTRFVVDMFVEPGAKSEDVQQWLDVYDRTFKEDKEVVTAQQLGYKSGMVPQGRLMTHREASIQMFQRRTWEALSRHPLLGGSSTAARPEASPITLHGITLPAPAAAATRAGDWESELEIGEFELGAQGVAVISLVSPDGADLPEWQPGAHIDLIMPGGIVRQYSLCGDPDDRRRWRIGVLREPNSRGGSAFVHEQLAGLGRVKVRGPRNHFPLEEADQYRFVAGGIGITPIMAMIRRAETLGKPWKLLYGGRSEESMAFLDELRAYGDCVAIVPQDVYGRLDLESYLDAAPAGTAVYACGPEPLLAALEACCAKRPALSLHLERFQAAPVTHAENTEFDLELRRSGKTLRVRKDQSVLEAVREAGVQIYSSCQNGVCGTCETPVLEGEPEHRDAVLTAAERATGKSMMLCVSRSKSDRLVLDL
ncbi:Rieske 2Fe-2S domain-containing protein [Pseudomonas sp. S 311-6]|nr:Rieske 2Fe-2S domain-containing protein [Pseudomonas sp. S 311-6]